MEVAVPGALVEDFEHPIPRLALPDPDDRHVLAAAIEGEADVIVTFNKKDFPAHAVRPYGTELQHPSSFLVSLLTVHQEIVAAALRAQRAGLRKPPLTVDGFLSPLRACGLGCFVTPLRETRVEL